MEDSAQRRWSGAVRGAIRDIAAEPDDMTRRGGAASRTHGRSPFQTQSARIRDSDIFSRQCVGGDGHPVGVCRNLKDPRIFLKPLVITFKSAELRRFQWEASEAKRFWWRDAEPHQRAIKNSQTPTGGRGGSMKRLLLPRLHSKQITHKLAGSLFPFFETGLR